MSERRPWGSYTILEEREAYKVKRIEVLPAKRLSYQRHQKRDEHWVIVEGEALVTVEGKDIPLSPGGSVDIPRMAAHRILNPGKSLLVFIEVQKGDYFGEDDIIRREDDYGRVTEVARRTNGPGPRAAPAATRRRPPRAALQKSRARA